MELAMDIPNLALATPELLLGVGAMVLLMIGVFVGGLSGGLMSGIAIAAHHDHLLYLQVAVQLRAGELQADGEEGVGVPLLDTELQRTCGVGVVYHVDLPQ